MRAKRLSFSLAAQADFDQIRTYFVQVASLRVAEAVVRKIRKRISAAREMPLAGTARPDYQNGCRFVVSDPYFIYYDYDGVELFVLRIIHKARDRDWIMGGG